MSKENVIHLTLRVGNEIKIDEDTDLLACIYSSEEKVERFMQVNCDKITLALGSLEMDNLYHSLLRTLRDNLGDNAARRLLEYIKGEEAV